MNQADRPVLIYFDIRGYAQLIRYMLLEIGAEFHEIFITDDGYLDPKLVETYNIEFQNLPYLIHRGLSIHGILPVVKYLCQTYGRGDLLGRTVQDSLRIAEIVVKYSQERHLPITALMKGIRDIQTARSGEGSLHQLAIRVAACFQQTQCWKLLDKTYARGNRFAFGYLTIVDFIMFENCFYYINLLRAVKEQPQNFAHRFYSFFRKTHHYSSKRAQIDKYRVFLSSVASDFTSALEQMWSDKSQSPDNYSYGIEQL